MRPYSRAIANFLMLIVLLNGVGNAVAASIEVEMVKGRPYVMFKGDIVSEDIDQFRIKTSALSNAIVVFSSDGGSLKAGVDIGSMIRRKNFMTIVDNGARCASACATAWLGGALRFMGEGARVGFHAAYRMQRGAALETGVGNAILGAYLNKLGLSDSAVVYITQASPQSMTWLDLKAAARLGIQVTLLCLDGSMHFGSGTCSHHGGER